MNDNNADRRWMETALREARHALETGEIPIAAILVDGNGTELGRAQTAGIRMRTEAAHAELRVIQQCGDRIAKAERPVTIYVNLEPCLMCLGAAMASGVDRIVYAMAAKVDGSARYVEAIVAGGQRPPFVEGGLLEKDGVALMRLFVEERPDHPRADYAWSLLRAYAE